MASNGRGGQASPQKYAFVCRVCTFENTVHRVSRKPFRIRKDRLEEQNLQDDLESADPVCAMCGSKHTVAEDEEVSEAELLVHKAKEQQQRARQERLRKKQTASIWTCRCLATNHHLCSVCETASHPSDPWQSDEGRVDVGRVCCDNQSYLDQLSQVLELWSSCKLLRFLQSKNRAPSDGAASAAAEAEEPAPQGPESLPRGDAAADGPSDSLEALSGVERKEACSDQPADGSTPATSESWEVVSRKRLDAAIRQQAVALHDRVEQIADELRQTVECQICYDRRVDTSFVPCGHRIMCSSCCTQLRAHKAGHDVDPQALQQPQQPHGRPPLLGLRSLVDQALARRRAQGVKPASSGPKSASLLERFLADEESASCEGFMGGCPFCRKPVTEIVVSPLVSESEAIPCCSPGEEQLDDVAPVGARSTPGTPERPGLSRPVSGELSVQLPDPRSRALRTPISPVYQRLLSVGSSFAATASEDESEDGCSEDADTGDDSFQSYRERLRARKRLERLQRLGRLNQSLPQPPSRLVKKRDNFDGYFGVDHWQCAACTFDNAYVCDSCHHTNFFTNAKSLGLLESEFARMEAQVSSLRSLVSRFLEKLPSVSSPSDPEPDEQDVVEILRLSEITAELYCDTCLENPINTVALPCGHRFSCSRCASGEVQTCPYCSVSVRKLLPTA